MVFTSGFIEYTSKMKLSYADYLSENNKDKIEESDIEKWINQIITTYKSLDNIGVLMNYFGVPKKYIESIKARKYKVECTNYTNYNKNKSMMLDLKITIEK